jgi:ribose transport system permease protein
MGMMFELQVIAAVVVGGTSLAGGSGRMFGTLIGAFIISVIKNGMNLLGMEAYDQRIVLGAVILGAALLDKLRLGEQLTKLFGGFLISKKERNVQ